MCDSGPHDEGIRFAKYLPLCGVLNCWTSPVWFRFRNERLPSLRPVSVAASRPQLRLDGQMIVDRLHEILPGAEVPFRRLHGRMPQEELDLFEVAAGDAAELDAGSSLMPHAA